MSHDDRDEQKKGHLPEPETEPMAQTDENIGQREDAPREGESPAEAPREESATPEEAEITPEPFQQVPNRDGQGGVSWEEQRKGMAPTVTSSLDDIAFDDRPASERLKVDNPAASWKEIEDGNDSKKTDASSD